MEKLRDTTKLLFATLLTFSLCFSASANVVGVDTHNFNPTDDGLGFVTVKPSETLPPGILSVGYFINYATNSLPFFPDAGSSSTQAITDVNDTLLSHDAHFAIGLMEGWDIGMNLPYILSQSIDAPSGLGTFAETGMNEIRINTKVRLYNENDSALAIAASLSWDRIINNPFSGTDPGPTINIEGIYDTMITKKWHWGLNLGYRMRNAGTPITLATTPPLTLDTMGDQFIYSTALSRAVNSWSTTLIFEIFGSMPIGDVQLLTDRTDSNLQAILGGRWNIGEDFDLHIGMGTELGHGFSTPDILLYAGFNYRFGPLWGGNDGDDDDDGVVNSRDRCPTTPRGRDVDENGCEIDGDNDGDGVKNSRDECPGTPEGEQVDSTGCSISSMATMANEPVDGDADNDGVLDSADQCPSSPPGTKVNRLGCAPDRVKSLVLQDLKFIYGTTKLTQSSRQKFQKNISKLFPIKDSIQKMVVEGHTDSKGRESYNQTLSEKRAGAIKGLLIKYLKVADDKVDSVGYGETQPIDTNNTNLGRARNRRVELQIIRESGSNVGF